MAELDKDLLSIQEARTLATQARDAQRKFLHATQAEVDRICAAMAQAAADAAVTLGKMASEETGYGVPEHKTSQEFIVLAIIVGSHQGYSNGRCDPQRSDKKRMILPGRWALLLR